MKDMGLYLVEMISWLAKQKQEPLSIVECGTIRDPRKSGHEDGLATYHIAKWVMNNAGAEFVSFELEHGKMRDCQEFLKSEALDQYVTFGLGDACILLQHFCRPVDFVYLDAGADVHQNLIQFRHAQAWMREPGFVVIDDVFDKRNADRGLLTVPWARLEGYKTAKIADRMCAIAFGEKALEYPLEWM